MEGHAQNASEMSPCFSQYQPQRGRSKGTELCASSNPLGENQGCKGNWIIGWLSDACSNPNLRCHFLSRRLRGSESKLTTAPGMRNMHLISKGTLKSAIQFTAGILERGI